MLQPEMPLISIQAVVCVEARIEGGGKRYVALNGGKRGKTGGEKARVEWMGMDRGRDV
jgi:hypothetical protein